MDYDILISNLTNPALLFFFLGVIAVKLKSDLEIPPTSAKFISLYLLFAIGFKGGQELSSNEFNLEIIWSLLFGVFLSAAVPLYTFFIVKKRLGSENAGAIAAAYGSVSAVTLVTAMSFLETQQIQFGGHMVAVMALMEVPSIIVGVLLVMYHNKDAFGASFGQVFKHSATNGSVILILGSLIIGFVTTESHVESIKPFTTDIFQGFLVVFLLDMGISSGKKLKSLLNEGLYPVLFAVAIPIVNGLLAIFLSQLVTDSIGNQFMFAILAASASYIAVPAAMKLAVPKANEGLYVPMALAITFPFNITIGMPLFLSIINYIK